MSDTLCSSCGHARREACMHAERSRKEPSMQWSMQDIRIHICRCTWSERRHVYLYTISICIYIYICTRIYTLSVITDFLPRFRPQVHDHTLASDWFHRQCTLSHCQCMIVRIPDVKTRTIVVSRQRLPMMAHDKLRIRLHRAPSREVIWL